MNMQIVAIIFQEGGKVLSELIRNRSPKRRMVVETTTIKEAERAGETTEDSSKASSIEAGCIPCAIGHLGTCSGLLNEAMRFAKKDGVESTEVITPLGG